MSSEQNSMVATYLQLAFNLSLSVVLLALAAALVDWYFFAEQYRAVIRPFGIAGIAGYALATLATLLLRKKL